MRSVLYPMSLLVLLITTNTCAAADFYVSPTGASGNSGSIASPWDLQTALNHPVSVHPGDTIWLRGGTYVGTFISHLLGSVASPITVRNYAQERAVLDGNIAEALASVEYPAALSHVSGGYTWYRGLEITNSNPQRTYTDLFVSAQPKRPGGVMILAPGVKLINLVIHDASDGITAWVPATDFEAHGNVIYNVGWNGPNGGNGHGIYTQNNLTSKLYENNISFNNFKFCAQLYGKQVDLLNNITFRKNIFYNPSSILFGGSSSTAMSNITYDENYQFNVSLQIGYVNQYNHDILITRNYFAFSDSNYPFVSLSKAVTITDNTMIAMNDTSVMILGLTALPANVPSDFTINRNIYHKTYVSPGTQFYIITDGPPSSQGICRSLWWNNMSTGYAGAVPEAPKALWQNHLGYDLNGTFNNVLPTGPKIFFTVNTYDATRANIAIYNWDRTNTVIVPAATVAQVLAAGDSYELHSTLDYLNDVSTGVYAGGNLSIAMTGHTVAKPIGHPVALGPTTFPDFGAFVLIKTASGGAPSAGMLAFSSAAYSQNEGNSGTATATISVTRSGGSSGVVGISYATTNGTATSASDYTAASGTLSWASGEMATKSFTVIIASDATVESDEIIALSLASPTSGASLGAPSTATLTITNDDVAPTPTDGINASSGSGGSGGCGNGSISSLVLLVLGLFLANRSIFPLVLTTKFHHHRL